MEVVQYFYTVLFVLAAHLVQKMRIHFIACRRRSKPSWNRVYADVVRIKQITLLYYLIYPFFKQHTGAKNGVVYDIQILKHFGDCFCVIAVRNRILKRRKAYFFELSERCLKVCKGFCVFSHCVHL